MKIRIRGNSLRLRLMQSEVTQLYQLGHVQEITEFGPAPEQTLVYRLEQSDTPVIKAAYTNHHIMVYIPKQLAEQWATSDEVGLSIQQTISEEHTLDILIEKDFQCLTVRPGEDETDAFPNPKDPH